MNAVEVIDEQSDLRRLVDEINSASWDIANDMTEYDAESLLAFLEHEGTIFVACHEYVDGSRELLGIASSRLEVKPYAKERWLYVDEVDVCADHRRKGAGKAIMRKLLNIANEEECIELWLGTEVDNDAANALYRSLEPEEVENFVGYTYGLKF